MPNRILHERICVSETIAELSAEEERFFYRLIVQCDDYGRFDGRPSVIRARCFALQLDSVSLDDIVGWLERLVEAGLVVMYVVDDRTFLRVTTWERYQQTRAKHSKYPTPVGGSQAPASTRNQTPTDDGTCHRNPDPGIEKREAKSGKRSRNPETRSDTPLSPPARRGGAAADAAGGSQDDEGASAIAGSDGGAEGGESTETHVVVAAPSGPNRARGRRGERLPNGAASHMGPRCPAGCAGGNHGGPLGERELREMWDGLADQPPWRAFALEHGRPDLAFEAPEPVGSSP